MSDRNSNTALAEAPQRAVASRAQGNDVRSMLERSKDRIAAVLPKHLSADRMLKIALVALTKNPALLKCDPMTVLRSVMTAAELGLDVGGALGSAYLVSYGRDCQLIIGYRGLIDLARRSGQIVSIEARVVYANDEFAVDYAIDGVKLRHRPTVDGDPGEFRLVYGVARLKDGGHQFEMMSKAQIEGIRRRSRSGNNGPWKTDYEEMARKTVVRRLAKYLPISVELAEAVGRDDDTDPNVVDGSLATGAAALNQRLQAPAATAPTLPAPPAVDGVADVEEAFDEGQQGEEPADIVDAQGDAPAGDPEQPQAGDAQSVPIDASSPEAFEATFAAIGRAHGMADSDIARLFGQAKLNNGTTRLSVREAVLKAFAAGALTRDGKLPA